MQTQFALVINTLVIMQMRLYKRLHVLHPITLLGAAKGKDWQPTLPPIRLSRGDPHSSYIRLVLGLSQARAILHTLLPYH